MNDILTIFHKSDFDGLCSEQIARKALGDTSDYLGFEYNEDIPDLKPYNQVYMIDISMPIEVMEKYSNKIIYLDHHKSQIDKFSNIPLMGRQIDGVAACRLAWQWFFGNKAATKEDYIGRKVEEPYSVQLLGEYDIWDKRNEDTDLFQVGLSSAKAIDWDMLLNLKNSKEYSESIVEKGQVIWDYNKVVNAQISKERGFDVDFESLKFRALNIARCNSMTFEASLQDHHDGCLAYFYNGKTWKFSLYHAKGKEHHDLSLIASKYGGGGHRGACGFAMDKLPKELGGIQ
jgi:hypothetical protein